jgi:hypothetical protein
VINKLILLLVFTASQICLAQEGPDAPAVADEPGNQTGQPEKLLDRSKKSLDNQVARVSQWVDAFFSDPNFEAESANTLYRFRPELYYRKEQGAKAKLKFRIKLHLPNFSRKTSLVIGSDDTVDSFEDTSDDSTEEPIIGLQFFGKQTKNWRTSLSVGLKFNEFAVFAGPRVRYLKPFGKQKSMSFTQAIRYQSNNYWNTISRLDLNFLLTDGFFFRQTFDGRLRGDRFDEEGFHTRVSSILTQKLKRGAGLQYDFTTIFHTRPESHVDRYVLSLRYRKRTKREWLYYEIVPQVSFDHEYDYVFNPGIRLRVEFFIGADTSAKFWRREHEDTEDFRW